MMTKRRLAEFLSIPTSRRERRSIRQCKHPKNSRTKPDLKSLAFDLTASFVKVTRGGGNRWPEIVERRRRLAGEMAAAAANERGGS